MPDPVVDVARMAQKEMKSRIYTVEEHDEFVKTLMPGDIICSKFANGYLYHAGIYCGPRKGAHEAVRKLLGRGVDMACPDCQQDIGAMDCGCGVQFVADVSLDHKKVEAINKSFSLFASMASMRPAGDSFTKFGFHILKDFMKETGAYKFNFLDEETTPLPVEKILHRAISAVTDGKYRREYDLISFNCEKFAAWCRYDKETSLQVIKAAKAAIGSALTLIVSLGAAALVSGATNRGKGKDEKEEGLEEKEDGKEEREDGDRK